MKELPIVGKQEQPLRRLIQAAHRLQPQPLPVGREQLHHRFLPVLRGGNIAGGLIEHNHHPPLPAQYFIVQGHCLGPGKDLSATVPLRDAVHRHPAAF